MARIVALQQRLAAQQPTPVPAEPPPRSTRPAPASALHTTPVPKACPAIARLGTGGHAARDDDHANAHTPET
jgi:hypothetical protein